MNGPTKPASPMVKVALKYLRSKAGSISAPAMNVSRMLPKPARKAIHSLGFNSQWRPKRW